MKAAIMLAVATCLLACDGVAAAAGPVKAAITADAPDDAQKLELREGLALERDGYVKIYGEVVNGHDVPVTFVRVDISLFDEDGTLISEERTYASRRVVPAGESTPFVFTRDVKKLPGSYHHHRLQVSAKPSPHGRTLVVEPEETKHESTRILTTGVLRNPETETCVSPEVVIAGYAADGRVVEVATMHPTNPEDRWDFVKVLGPGESAPFRVSLPLRGEAIARVRTWGSCSRDLG